MTINQNETLSGRSTSSGFADVTSDLNVRASGTRPRERRGSATMIDVERMVSDAAKRNKKEEAVGTKEKSWETMSACL